MQHMIPTWVDGTLTPVEKLDAHRRGLMHQAVSVFVLCGADVLIQRRALDKYHTPGLWANTCCTHPHWGESAPDCAHRRLDEELGITGLTLLPRGQVTYRADVGGGLIEHEQVDVFLARVAQPISLSPNPDEVMDTRWIAHDALLADIAARPDIYTPWLRLYMTDHADQIFG
ncbi:MAG: isopentenyl-diphosphate Delta-isomerase [Paracoccaceae bacterium]